MTAAPGDACILGWGCIAAPGYGPEQIDMALSKGGTAPAANFNWSCAEGRGPSIRAITNFTVSDYLQMRGLRPLSRATLLGCVAAAAAVDHPRRLTGPSTRHAIVAGTRRGSIEPLVEFNQSAMSMGPHSVNPAHFPNVVANVHAGYLGILFDLAGPNVSVCGASAGLEAVALAGDLLRLDRAMCVLAGGVEALGATVLQGLERAGELSDGLVPGEGAAFLVLGREAMVDRPALARLSGWAVTTAHSAADLARARAAAVTNALAAARTPNTSIGTVWLTGAKVNSDAPGTDFSEVPVRALRSACGDCESADGALAAVLAAFDVRRSRVPALITAFPPVGNQVAVVIRPA